MKFLIDNALSIKIAVGLRDVGYDAIHVTGVSMGAASDTEIFQFAIQEDRIVISADTDFETLLALYKTQKPSVILLRLGTQMQRAEEQIALLILNLPPLEANLMAGSIIIFDPTTIRVRTLPIGGSTSES